VTRLPLTLRPATASDYHAILGLIKGATQWLPTKGTDQWSKPWPDEQRRNARVREDLLGGKTWLAMDEMAAAATITVDPVDNVGVWPAQRRHEPAVYLRRLIVDRRYRGLEVGARLLDWAADFARGAYEAQWIRIDVWTTNFDLHDYYRVQGFEDAGLRDLDADPDYPSRALFQRNTAQQRPDYGAALKVFHQPGPHSRPNGRARWAGSDILRQEWPPESQ
jgi:GNAT superfamily N-acetyltransferase